jgi:hypothetical protein
MLFSLVYFSCTKAFLFNKIIIKMYASKFGTTSSVEVVVKGIFSSLEVSPPRQPVCDAEGVRHHAGPCGGVGPRDPIQTYQAHQPISTEQPEASRLSSKPQSQYEPSLLKDLSSPSQEYDSYSATSIFSHNTRT